MEFNVGKCNILCAGKNNLSHNYCLNVTPISISEYERDLSISVSSGFRPRAQCIQIRKHANWAPGFISWTASNRSAKVFLKLYLTLVWHHLGYEVQFRSLYYRVDIKILESLQRRMTKIIQRLRNPPYEERLSHLNLHFWWRRFINERSAYMRKVSIRLYWQEK